MTDDRQLSRASRSSEWSIILFEVRVVGRVESPLSDPFAAPRQPDEGAPAAWLVFEPDMLRCLGGICLGDHLIVVTWLHRAGAS